VDLVNGSMQGARAYEAMAMERQSDLFGEPPRLAEKSQFWTPLWLARRMAGWVVGHKWRVLEPCVGRGNLVEGLIRAGHPATSILGLELDPRYVKYTYQKFEKRVPIVHANFLEWTPPELLAPFDVVFMNPPYEENLHMQFVLHALELAPFVIALVPITFEYSKERDCELWSQRGVIRRRAQLPERVKFAEGKGGEIDCEVLFISRRMEPRRVGEEREVIEETWRPDDLPEAA
jgi:predicted RNA methylase